MKIEMKGKEKTLKFGVGFVRKLDSRYRAQIQGIEFGAGLTLGNLYIEQRNPSELSYIILCAIEGGSTIQAVDNFIEECAEEDGDLEQLFVDIDEAMGKSSVVKSTMKNQDKQVAEVKEQSEND